MIKIDDFALAVAALDLAIVYADQSGTDPRKLECLQRVLKQLRDIQFQARFSE